MQYLTLNEFLIFSIHSKRIAVFREIAVDVETPMDIYRTINEVYGPYGVIYEIHEAQHAHYSYMAFDSMATLTVTQGDQRNPLDALRHMQSQFSFSTKETVAGQITSAIGFMSYDLVRCFENLPDRHPNNTDVPLLSFNFYTISLTYDYVNKTILISVLVDVSTQPEADYQKAQEKIAKIIKLIAVSGKKEDPIKQEPADLAIKTDISDDDFMLMVAKAKEYIMAGDAFQIVLSRCFHCHYSVSPLTIYETLCNVSPAPFMFYLPSKEYIILGASPERMVRVVNREVTVNPIAGTRKRESEDLDDVIKADLFNNEKEHAEHIMLVDLARNDVGSVAKPGSVVVKDLLNLKCYSHVIHMTSTIQGELCDDYDAFDAFAHTFPAGTLSGAPKIRAMEIIDELEVSRRGVYGGAIARIDAQGHFDSCIAIRMAYLKNGIANIRVGAGIVYDSDPVKEVEETHHKAQSMLSAITRAHGGSHDINY